MRGGDGAGVETVYVAIAPVRACPNVHGVGRCALHGVPTGGEADGRDVVGAGILYGGQRGLAACNLEFYQPVLFLNLRDGHARGESFAVAQRGRGVVGEGSDVVRAGEGIGRARSIARTAIGFHEVHALQPRRGVYLIGLPKVGIVRDVPNEHSVTGQIGVPARLLAVFEQEILVCAPLRGNAQGVARGDVFKHDVARRGIEVLGREPAEREALVGGIGGRRVRMVVVRTYVHDGPVAGREIA